MPFKSQAQRKMFFARGKNSPKWAKMAKKWAAHTPKGKKLPKHVSEGDVTDLVRPEPEAVYNSKSLKPAQVSRLKSLGFSQDKDTLYHPDHWEISSGIMVPRSADARAWLSRKADGEEDAQGKYPTGKAERVPLSSVFKDASDSKMKKSDNDDPLDEDSPEGGLPWDDAETDEYMTSSSTVDMPKMYEVFQLRENPRNGKFKAGDRVKIKADPEQGLPEIRGEVADDCGFSGPPGSPYIIYVDKQYHQDSSDDGLREVPEDQLEPETEDVEDL